MNIFTIPIRCLRQKWLRSATLGIVFLLGISSVVVLRHVSSSIAEGFEKKLSVFGANIIIAPKLETLHISYGGIPLGNTRVDSGRLPLRETEHAIKSIPLKDRIAIIAPKLAGLVQYQNASGEASLPDTPVSVPLVGVRFEDEAELKQFWSVQGSIPGVQMAYHAMHGMEHASGHMTGHTEKSSEPVRHTPAMRAMPPKDGASFALNQRVIVGATLANRLGIAPASVIALNGRSYFVEGVLHATGSDDDNVILADLHEVQHLLGEHNSASFIEIAALCSGCPIEDIVMELEKALPASDIKALRQVVEQRMYSIGFAQNMAFVVVVVILLSACAMVVMSMLASINERRKEIGVLRAVGFSRANVFFVFAAESMVIGMAAGIGGYGAGCLAGGYVTQALQLEPSAYPVLSFAELALFTLGSALLAMLAASFPACKAARLNPAEALSSL